FASRSSGDCRPVEAGRAGEGTRNTTSPGTDSLSRLVARMPRRGHERKSGSARSAHAAIRGSPMSGGGRGGRGRGGGPGEGRAEGGQEGTSGELADVEDGGDRSGHEGRIGKRGEVDKPDTVGEVVEHRSAELHGEASLSATPAAGEREQASRREKAAKVLDLPLAPDEAGHLDRRVVPGGRSLAPAGIA